MQVKTSKPIVLPHKCEALKETNIPLVSDNLNITISNE